MGVLGTIGCEHLQVDCQTAIHASLFHSTESVNTEVVIGVDAAVETVDTQTAIVTGGTDEPSRLESIGSDSAVDAWSKCWYVVAHYLLFLFAT